MEITINLTTQEIDKLLYFINMDEETEDYDINNVIEYAIHAILMLESFNY